MQEQSSKVFLRYIVPLLSVAACALLQFLIWPLLDRSGSPFTCFLLAIVLSALYGGRTAGLLATALSAISARFLFIEPIYTLHFVNFAAAFRLLLFIVVGVVVCFVIDAQMRVREESMKAKQAEQKLRSDIETVKTHLETVLSGISESFVTLDREWHYTYVNARTLERSGKTREDFLGKCIWELYPGLVDTPFYMELHRAIDERKSVQFDFYFPALAHWYDCRAVPLSEGVAIFTANITGRKQAELSIIQLNRELERRANELQAIFDIAPVGIAVAHDPNGDVITANAALAKMFQVPPGENISLSAPEAARLSFKLLRDGGEIPLEELPMRRAMREKQPVIANDMEVVRPDGTHIMIYGYAVPIIGKDGEVLGCISTFMDITERRRTEQILQRYYLLSERTRDIILFVQRDGRIMEANQAAADAYGYNRDTLLTKNIYDLRAADTSPLISAQMDQADGGGVLFETLHQRRDGTIFPVEVSSIGTDIAGERVLLSIIRDISERKRAEEERAALLAAEREARTHAEEANRLKDDFLATVSHELRTPLNAILGWARLLHVGDLTPATREHALGTIERNARMQAQLIDDVLDVSRIITGRLRLDIQPVRLRPVVEAALETVYPAATAKDITIQKTYEDEEVIISGDANRLQQVVWNLLSNAVKFTPRGGRVQINLLRQNSHIEIAVSDNGQGINAEFLPYVFDRFRQADSSTTRRAGGLGLGLAIVRHLVELHGGSVRAESPGPGQGATFIVCLPLTSRRNDEEPFGEAPGIQLETEQTCEKSESLQPDTQPVLPAR